MAPETTEAAIDRQVEKGEAVPRDEVGKVGRDVGFIGLRKVAPKAPSVRFANPKR